MKRYLTLAILVLLAVSCGGRRGHKDADGALEDSLAVAEQAKPATPADSLADLKKLNTLPQEPIFDVVTSQGTFRVKLYKDTPKHRNNFARLALTHFYDGVLFHRVVPGFVIQGGDPYTRDTSRVAEWGEGGPGYNIDPEILPAHTHKKGALAAARRGDLANPLKESSGSQFYVVVNPKTASTWTENTPSSARSSAESTSSSGSPGSRPTAMTVPSSPSRSCASVPTTR